MLFPVSITSFISWARGMKLAGFLLAVAILIVPLGAQAEVEKKVLGVSGAWTIAVIYDDKGFWACTVTAEPEVQRGKYSRRGKTFIQITHWYRDQQFNVLRFVAGYPIKNPSNVTFSINGGGKQGAKYQLIPHGSDAWTSDTLDAEVVKTMMEGDRLDVHSTSQRGTKTHDSYSLAGLRRAVLRAGRACLKR